MCGVIGYVGHRPAQARLLRALERLEYRGYDSAGICLGEAGGLRSVKSVGNLARLRAEIEARGGSGATIGVGHTRWATHGRVSVENAHPLAGDHEDELALVLNGIIENFESLRDELRRDGAVFRSETDAEVVVHLVERAYAGDLVAAVRAAVERLRGHFAFVVIHRDHPDLLVGARRHCPLVVGLGDDETFLASSVTAFAGETRRLKLVADGEVVAIRPQSLVFLGPDGTPRDHPEVTVAGDDAAADKRGHETFMLKEIHEQPEAVARSLDGIAADIAAIEQDAPLDRTHVRRAVIVACGTAFHAGLLARHAIEGIARIPCEVEVASEWRYRDPVVADGTLVLGISQSGETADTIAAMRLARERGARTLALTNTPGSQITREVGGSLFTRAGLEMGVAATKTFTAQGAVLLALALRMAETGSATDRARLATVERALRTLPEHLERALGSAGAADAAAADHASKPYFFFLGRGAGLPIALEGALKLREIAYIPTEAYAAGEMKHGPIALIDPQTPVVAVAIESRVGDKLMSNLQEVRARGGQIIAVAPQGDSRLGTLHGDVLPIPAADPLIQPVLATVPLQLLAYRVARLRGLEIDQPRNLAKTVTVE